jgi:hypothetical protein
MHTIKWNLKEEVTTLGRAAPVYESPNLFTAAEAQRLTQEANAHFVRAHHWCEPAQARRV